jgi:hypothetical protein
MYSALVVAGSISPTATSISMLKIEQFSNAELEKSTKVVFSIYKNLGGTDQVAKGTQLRTDVMAELQTRSLATG